MSTKSLRIAIADDERDMRDFLQKVLPRLGHQVVCAAESGPELVSACRQSHPDLIITDLKMPGGDGLAAVEEIWRERQVPVIIVSAYPQDVSERWRQQPLLTAVLMKPIKSVDLEPVIARVASSTD
jgi:CheY-like chemotaxis protein